MGNNPENSELNRRKPSPGMEKLASHARMNDMQNNTMTGLSRSQMALGLWLPSFFIHLFGLIFPIVILQIYTHVIPNADVHVLLYLLLGVCLAIVLEISLRSARNMISSWADIQLANHQAWQQYQANNLALIDTIQDQDYYQQYCQRIDNFFILVYFLLFAYLSQWLAIVPIIGLALNLVISKFIGQPRAVTNKFMEFLLTTFANIHHLNPLANMRLFNHMQQQNSLYLYRRMLQANLIKTWQYFFTYLTFILVLIVGATIVLQGKLSLGSLAACFLLALHIMRFKIIIKPAENHEQSAVIAQEFPDETKTKAVDLSKKQLIAYFGQQHSAYSQALLPLLQSLSDQHESTELIAALPIKLTTFNCQDLLMVMKRLGYYIDNCRLPLQFIEKRLTPALFVHDNQVFLVHNNDAGEIIITENEQQRLATETDLQSIGTLYHFSKQQKQNKPDRLLSIKQPHLFLLLAINFFIALLMLSIPLYTQGIFDAVINNSSSFIFSNFTIGVSASIISLLLLGLYRSRLLTLNAVQMSDHINQMLYPKIIKDLQQQKEEGEEKKISNWQPLMNHFIVMTNFFTQGNFSFSLTLPFTLLFLVVLGLLTGNLLLVTLLSLLAIGLFTIASRHRLQQTQQQLIESKQRFQLVLLQNQLQKEKLSEQDFKKISANYLLNLYHWRNIRNIVKMLAFLLLMVSSLTIIFVASVKIMLGQLSMGALLSSLLLSNMVLLPWLKLLINFDDLLSFKHHYFAIKHLLTRTD